MRPAPVVAVGQSIGRLKYALRLAGTAARMTVDPPDADAGAAIAAEAAALSPQTVRAVNQGAG